MIKHIVMWQTKEEARGKTKQENAAEIKTLVEGLKGQIEGLLYIEVGVNALPDPNAFDIVLTCVFEDEAAFEHYKTHPKHVAVASVIGEVKTARAVVDYYVDKV